MQYMVVVYHSMVLTNFLFAQQSKLVLVLIACLHQQFWIDATALRVGSQWTAEEKNVRFGAVKEAKFREKESMGHTS